MKKSFKFLALMILCFMFIPTVYAKTIDHFYAIADETIVFEDEVKGSAAFAGDSVESKGIVNGVNFLAGNKVSYAGQSDYLVLSGNSITVSGVVINDAIIAGNVIDIKGDADLQRDVVIFGSDITISGKLNRNVTVYGGKVLIKDSNIGGNVKVYSEKIDVEDSVLINGNLSYPEDASATISSSIENITKTSSIKQPIEADFMTLFIEKIWSFMSIVFIFAILSLLIPIVFEKINEDYEQIDFNRGVSVIARGLLFLIIVPVLALLLLILPFGIPLSLIIFALYLIVIYISKVFVGYLIGYKIWQKLFKKDTNILFVGVLGYLILFILSLIPGINTLTSLFVLLFGIGIIISLLIEHKP